MNQLLIAENANQAKQLSRRCAQKKIRRIYRGIYTEDQQAPIADIIKNNWMKIASHIVSGGILSFRTAVDLKPAPFQGGGIVFMTSTYDKMIALPGLVIKVFKGNNHDYVEQVLPETARSDLARRLLENLTIVRKSAYSGVKTIGIDGVENILAKEMRLRGEKQLNQLRFSAKEVSARLGYADSNKKLNRLISALLSTHPDQQVLSSAYAKAVAQRKPYDSHRIKLFEALAVYLKKCKFKNREYTYQKTSFKNLTFFESYFSNFIEGTEFIIDEAEDIVFKGIEVDCRHEDSHDVLSNFSLSNDYFEMSHTPESAKMLLTILQQRHAYIMEERPDKRPGKFKEKPNKCGSTYFVAPEDVLGTLCHGFELYNVLDAGLEKALFMQFLVSEVHPFDDGNGRLSRIMMNAELVSAGLFKMMIPCVHRDNYLNGLRLASRDHRFYTYCKSMDQAQAYTASIDWLDYGQARETIEKDDANLTADEGLPTFNRALRKLELSEFV
jgi:Fic family protein